MNDMEWLKVFLGVNLDRCCDTQFRISIVSLETVYICLQMHESVQGIRLCPESSFASVDGMIRVSRSYEPAGTSSCKWSADRTLTKKI